MSLHIENDSKEKCKLQQSSSQISDVLCFPGICGGKWPLPHTSRLPYSTFLCPVPFLYNLILCLFSSVALCFPASLILHTLSTARQFSRVPQPASHLSIHPQSNCLYLALVLLPACCWDPAVPVPGPNKRGASSLKLLCSG